MGAASFDAGITNLPRAGGGGSSTATTGYGSCIRTGAQGTGRFGGVTEHDYNTRHECVGGHLGGEQRARGRMRHRGSEPLPPGAHGDRRQLLWVQSSSNGVLPFHSARCFRVSSDPGESWSNAMGSGRRHRQYAAEGAARQDHVDLALRRTPRKQDCQEQARVFTSDFPSLI